jgi:pyridoxal phosphate enzyme (YggS family)
VSGADIAANLADVRRAVADAAHHARRDPADIRLVAVSKTFPAEDVRSAVSAGQRDFGENRVQEGLEKVEALAQLGLEWHLIGHLQSNKAAKAARAFHWIHAVDGRELAEKLDRAASEAGVRPQILVQVDLAHEATKSGADRKTVPDVVKAVLDARALDLRGLMIVPPIPDNPEDSRPWFRQLRDLRDELVAQGTPAARLAELSMGMSHDFAIAIAEGATIVRVGTAIFGRRTPAPPA